MSHAAAQCHAEQISRQHSLAPRPDRQTAGGEQQKQRVFRLHLRSSIAKTAKQPGRHQRGRRHGQRYPYNKDQRPGIERREKQTERHYSAHVVDEAGAQNRPCPNSCGSAPARASPHRRRQPSVPSRTPVGSVAWGPVRAAGPTATPPGRTRVGVIGRRGTALSELHRSLIVILKRRCAVSTAFPRRAPPSCKLSRKRFAQEVLP